MVTKEKPVVHISTCAYAKVRGSKFLSEIEEVRYSEIFDVWELKHGCANIEQTFFLTIKAMYEATSQFVKILLNYRTRPIFTA